MPANAASRRSRTVATPDRPSGVDGIATAGSFYLSAEDFDATGILTGVEPCASSYWWIPELQQGPDPAWSLAGGRTDAASATLSGETQLALPARGQAARRSATRPTAAA